MAGATPDKPLPVMYHEYVASSVDEKGIGLNKAILVDGDGALTIYALDIPVPQAYRLMLADLHKHSARELIFGFDRYAKEGQGTTLGDLVAGFHVTTGFAVAASPIIAAPAPAWTPFVIEYQHEPRIVKPIDWGNGFWNAALRNELAGTIAELVGVRH